MRPSETVMAQIRIKHRFTGKTLKVVEGADLHEANLSGANLHGANLSRADLHGANLSGANLSSTSLCGATVDGAVLAHEDIGGPGHILAGLTDDEWKLIQKGRSYPCSPKNHL